MVVKSSRTWQHEDHANARMLSHQALGELGPQHAGHPDIAEDKMDRLIRGAGYFECLQPTSRLEHRVAFAAELSHEQRRSETLPLSCSPLICFQPRLEIPLRLME
jgi:hypothetical protein